MKTLLALILLILVLNNLSLAQDWQFLDESDIRLPANIQTQALGLDGGDVNGDNSIDLLAGCMDNMFENWPGFEQLYINDGTGYYALVDSGLFPWANDLTSEVLLFDCDFDGDLDAFVGNINYISDYIAINDGSGLFVKDTLRIAPDAISALSASYSDVDCDGDIDLLVLNNQCSVNQPHALWINDGRGFFQNENWRLPPLVSCYEPIEFADIDFDLDPDILAVRFYHSGPPVLLINDGQGFFLDESVERLPNTDSLGYRPSAKFMDVDADGDFDILVASQTECIFLINDGSGYFSNQSEHRGIIYERSSARDEKDADLNNDGLDDLVLGMQGNHNLVFINIGNGFFEDQTEQRLPILYNTTEKLFIGDFDNDGDADIFRVGTDYGINSIYINTLNSIDSFPPVIKNQTIFPSIVTEPGPYPVRLVAQDGVSIEYQLSCHIHYSADRITFYSDSLHYTGGYIFYGTIPETDSGTIVYYYYTAIDKEGNESRVPANAPDSLFSFIYLPGYVGIEEGNNQLPERISLSAYPNPFNSKLLINLSGVEEGEPKLEIFDITGKLIRTLQRQNKIGEGNYQIIWDAKDDLHNEVSSGAYFIKARTARYQTILKVLFLK